MPWPPQDCFLSSAVLLISVGMPLDRGLGVGSGQRMLSMGINNTDKWKDNEKRKN